MKGKYWHSMNLHAQMPYVHCTSIMNMASDPEDKKPKSRVLPLQITAERRQGRGNIQCQKLRFLQHRMFISVSDYPHDSLVRGYTDGPRSRSCDIDAEALQVWASATDPGGSCRQVCFLNLLLLKSPIAFTQLVSSTCLFQVWMDLGTGKANTSWLKGLKPMKCFEFSAIHEL